MNHVINHATDGLPQRSLSSAIFRYRSDWNAFLAASLEEPKSGEDLAAMFKPSMKVIETWSRPAESQEEAAMALRLALEDYEAGDSPRIPAMIKAALGFFTVAHDVDMAAIDREQGDLAALITRHDGCKAQFEAIVADGDDGEALAERPGYRDLYIAASDAQITAFQDLLRFRCRHSTAQDVKARYLAGIYRKDQSFADPEHIMLLIESLTA